MCYRVYECLLLVLMRSEKFGFSVDNIFQALGTPHFQMLPVMVVSGKWRGGFLNAGRSFQTSRCGACTFYQQVSQEPPPHPASHTKPFSFCHSGLSSVAICNRELSRVKWKIFIIISNSSWCLSHWSFHIQGHLGVINASGLKRKDDESWMFMRKWQQWSWW